LIESYRMQGKEESISLSDSLSQFPGRSWLPVSALLPVQNSDCFWLITVGWWKGSGKLGYGGLFV
jgi:hypothetical protein